ncbi:MAG: hypothetical protein A3C72_02800 [Candidatus Taylorbacteria bacterium RIFCSPHIGHO2_02_FULL_43_32b]|uniref:Uncharacterized protein n=1 Tax=Candidatus Taylorbacteria bacterium RIFCSPHIGHO2_02_FULL_43_32b TaxID=1802306 RepID=A0A1G2MG12_9BACT|nr:MAG: hypothetical protein A3C72_02800 [Candidatus Taylorbacteria bacterium RIFCSPHIGHO2_02_FULL_43_32b]
MILIAVVTWYERPNCFDNMKNQDEFGVDCGGSCAKVCTNEIAQISPDWVRFFEVKYGVYSVAVRAQNPNNLVAFSVPYRIKLYGSTGLLLGERDGEVYIPPNQAFGIFEGAISVPNDKPARVTFEWRDKTNWVKNSAVNKPMVIKDVIRSFNGPGFPRVTALMENTSLQTVRNVRGVAIVYDLNGNAIAASKTIIDKVAGGGKAEMVFSWPVYFGQEARVEILHWLLPMGEQ